MIFQPTGVLMSVKQSVPVVISVPLVSFQRTLAWAVRAALRSVRDDERWGMVQDAIDAMTPAERAKDPAWAYWRARAVAGRAAAGPAGDEARAAARTALQALASPFTFYGKLAIEDLGGRFSLPPAPTALTAAEREAAAAHPGLRRGLQMIALGLRPEDAGSVVDALPFGSAHADRPSSSARRAITSSGNEAMSPHPIEMHTSPGRSSAATPCARSARDGKYATCADGRRSRIADATSSPVTPGIRSGPEA
jgi:hypothetical protein